MRQRLAAMGLALGALGACGDVAIEEEMTYGELVAANAEMAARVTGWPDAAAAEVPVTGSATFEGFATLVMETPRTTDLVGRATLTADFGNDSIAGTLEDFAGRVNGAAVQELDGEIAVTDGDLRVLAPSVFRADLGGLLTGGGQVLGVEGGLLGSFRAEPGSEEAGGLAALSTAGTDFTLNGQEHAGSLAIVGER